MTRLILASNNEKKIKELRQLCASLPVEILTLEQIGYHEEIIEDGITYEQNATIKINAIKDLYKDAIIIADDSGLEVDALNGEPGVYSARYDITPQLANDKLLRNLEGVKDRKARFMCVIALSLPGQELKLFKGVCEGEISMSSEGVNGFGYDPIFYSYDLAMIMALATPEQKASVSHRGIALRQAIEEISAYYGN